MDAEPHAVTSPDADRRLAAWRSIDLASLDALASHQRRFDNKYVVPLDVLDRLLSVLDGQWEVLELRDARSFRYHSVYFDDPSLGSFRSHIQQRRRRHKVRVRRYDDGLEVLEVKLKTGRGLTDKHRLTRPLGGEVRLSDAERAWIADVVGVEGVADELEAALIVDYVRSTLVHRPTRERMTLDRELSVARVGIGVVERPIGGAVVVEVKSGAARGLASRTMLALGERPTSFSKYCVGLAAVSSGLDHRMLADASRRLTAGR